MFSDNHLHIKLFHGVVTRVDELKSYFDNIIYSHKYNNLARPWLRIDLFFGRLFETIVNIIMLSADSVQSRIYFNKQFCV